MGRLKCLFSCCVWLLSAVHWLHYDNNSATIVFLDSPKNLIALLLQPRHSSSFLPLLQLAESFTTGTNILRPALVPSQLQSSLAEAATKSWEGRAIDAETAQQNGVRKVVFLAPPIPAPIITASVGSGSGGGSGQAGGPKYAILRNHIKSSVDHTLFVYPATFERFTHR